MNNTGQIDGVPKNPRLIKDDKFKKLVKSLKELPIMLEKRPIIIDENNIIIGGNMRHKAAKEAGLKEVPIETFTRDDAERNNIEAKKLNPDYIDKSYEEQVKEMVIKDNVSGGEWDWDLLANEWDAEELDEWGLDTPDDWGDDKEVDEDEAPEVDESEPPKSKLGEIYQLGRHRVGCMDSTVKENVEMLMDGNKADMVFTDPPYGVDYSGGIQFTKDGVKKNQRDRLADDHKTTDIYSRVVPIIPHFTKGAVYMWFADTQVVPVYQAVEKVGDIHALIIWVKNGGYSAMNANYKQKHEPCLYWKPKGGKLNFTGASTETTIWELNKDGVNEYHPTQKPIALCAKAIQNHEAKTVLDLFLGSGSTLIACEQTDRTCFGMELSEAYTDVVRKRWAKYVYPDRWEEEWESLTPAIE